MRMGYSRVLYESVQHSPGRAAHHAEMRRRTILRLHAAGRWRWRVWDVRVWDVCVWDVCVWVEGACVRACMNDNCGWSERELWGRHYHDVCVCVNES